jgi:hypothetical protein
VAHGGHDIEWLTPDGDAWQETGFDSDHGRTAVGRWLRSRPTQQRRFLGALLALALTVLATITVVRGPSAEPPPPPTWLANRPFNAPLSPLMAAECFHRDCDVRLASNHDLTSMRGLLHTSRVTIGGERVSDAHGQLRGADVWLSDNEGDLLSINAVRVSQAPRSWSPDSATLEDGSIMSRWVLHARSGVWLVEVDAIVGCSDGHEAAILYALAFHRVRAAQLNL